MILSLLFVPYGVVVDSLIRSWMISGLSIKTSKLALYFWASNPEHLFLFLDLIWGVSIQVSGPSRIREFLLKITFLSFILVQGQESTCRMEGGCFKSSGQINSYSVRASIPSCPLIPLLLPPSLVSAVLFTRWKSLIGLSSGRIAHGMHLLNRGEATKPKSLGGLGIKNPHTFRTALAVSPLYKLINKHDPPCQFVAKYWNFLDVVDRPPRSGKTSSVFRMWLAFLDFAKLLVMVLLLRLFTTPGSSIFLYPVSLSLDWRLQILTGLLITVIGVWTGCRPPLATI